jgi:NADH-quinone oxidoreductase subunit I
MGAFNTYLDQIWNALISTQKGMALTWQHLWAAKKQRTIHDVKDPNYFKSNEGVFTTQYPAEQIEIPDRGRYQLDNVMEDCIVCDKCVKICPVDCIEIDPIKATGLVGYASDGSPIRLYAAKFDIDMSKCCFCGLCTTVCPTECLTMTSEYDFSTFDVKDHLFHYSNLSPEEAEEKRRLYEQFVAEKEAAKKVQNEQNEVLLTESNGPIENNEPNEVKGKPAFKPGFKPAFKPIIKKENVKTEEVISEKSEEGEVKQEMDKPKPAFKPSFKPKIPKPNTDNTTND